jgi:hypothetical protein
MRLLPLLRPAFQAKPSQATQRDGGDVNEAGKQFLEKLIEDQLTKVSSAMGQQTLTPKEIDNALAVNLKYYGITLNENLKQRYEKIEALYREIMARIVASLENFTPKISEIHITEDKPTKGLEIQTGVGNNRSTHSVIPFTPLVHELKQAEEPIVFGQLRNSEHGTPNHILGQLIQAIDPTVLNASKDNIPNADHRQNIIDFNGNMRISEKVIKDKEGNIIGRLTVRMIEALEKKEYSRRSIDKLFGFCTATVSRFVNKVGNSFIRYSDQTEQRKTVMQSFIDTHLNGYIKTYPKGATKKEAEYQWLDLTENEILKLAQEQDLDLGLRYTIENTLRSLGYKTKGAHSNIKRRLELFDKLTALGFNTGSLTDRLGAYIEACNKKQKALPEMVKELGIKYKTLQSLIIREGLELPVTKGNRWDDIKKATSPTDAKH